MTISGVRASHGGDRGSGGRIATGLLAFAIGLTGAVAVAAPAAAVPAPDIIVTQGDIGTSPEATWVADSSDAAWIVTDAGRDVLGLDGSVIHRLGAQTYPLIDNTLSAGLGWMSFFSGATSGEVDPATGEEIPTTGVGLVEATLDGPSRLWLDVEIAFGDTAAETDLAYVSCELPVGDDWKVIDLNDCSSIDDDLNARWIVTEPWTFEDPWLGEHTYAAGDHLNVMNGGPGYAAVSGIGLRTEGGPVQIATMTLRDQVVGFEVTPSLHVDPYFTAGGKYQGIGVDLKATNVTDATEVRVTVHRALGGDVVKTSRAGVLNTVNAGGTVTAPIVVQPGTYNEAGSGSWWPATAGGATPVWTPETLPTGVTVELLRGEEVIVERTVASIGTSIATLADVMPAAPRFTTPTATFRDAANYTGIAVDIRVDGFRDAEQVIVQVDRADGQPVVKRSKWAAAAALNTGQPKALTAPIVIQPGTYDEAGSSSWLKPVAVWTPTSMPTSVTVTITRTYGPDLVTTLPISGSSVGVLPTETPTAPIVVEIPTDVPTYEVEVPTDAEDVKLKLGAPVVTPEKAEITVPVEVVVSTEVGANLTIAANTTASSTDTTWDGVIQLPKTRTDVVVPAATGQTTTVGVAIELGSPTARIDFDSPVKLVLAGQAGKRAGYVQGGTFHAIDDACALPAPGGLIDGECWVNEGGDLVIWTTHFTTFVSYTSAATPDGGGGSGGEGSGGGGSSGGSGSGPSGSSSSGAGSSGITVVLPSTAPTTAPTAKPTTRATTPPKAAPAPKPAPTEDADVAGAAGGESAGGFDPVWLVIILVPLGILVIGGAAYGMVRARRS